MRNLAGVLERLGRFEDALLCLRKCVESPENLIAQSQLHSRMGDLETERALVMRVADITADPKLAAMLRSSVFDSPDAMREMFRMRTGIKVGDKHTLPLPLWDGATPESQRLVVHWEEGLGDTVQFARFVPRLAERVARLDFVVQPALVDLLRSMPGRHRLLSSASEAKGATAWAQALSLPGYLALDSEADLWAGPYLAADPDRIAQWRRRLPQASLRIGIAWQGNPSHRVDIGRSFPSSCYAALAAVPGVVLISLQKIDGKTVVADGLPIHVLRHFDDGRSAFLDTAAVIDQLDLVITSDTSVAHVAGALGAPTWVLLQNMANWRWQRGRDDTPWYPSMRLFRQTVPGDWAGVHARVVDEVRALMARRVPA